MKHRPLFGNHCAKQLKIYFRTQHIPYCQFNYTISVKWPNDRNFQPWTFQFEAETNSIKLYNKLDLSKVYHFPFTSITKLFELMIKLKIITKPQLPL